MMSLMASLFEGSANNPGQQVTRAEERPVQQQQQQPVGEYQKLKIEQQQQQQLQM